MKSGANGVSPSTLRPGDFLVFEDGQCKEVESCIFERRYEEDDGFAGWSISHATVTDVFYRVSLVHPLNSSQRVFDLKLDGRLHYEDPRKVPNIKMVLKGSRPTP